MKAFLDDLIKNSNINFSTIEIHDSHLRIYLKKQLVISFGELKGLMNYSRYIWVKRKLSVIYFKVTSEAY